MRTECARGAGRSRPAVGGLGNWMDLKIHFFWHSEPDITVSCALDEPGRWLEVAGVMAGPTGRELVDWAELRTRPGHPEEEELVTAKIWTNCEDLNWNKDASI